MKIGVCTGVENIKKMEDIGFDYIEPSVVSIAKMNDEEFNAAMNLVDGSNIKCEAFNVLFPGNIRLTGPEVDEGGIKDYLERAFARVSRLGAKVIVFGSGGARKIPDGWSREEAWKQLVRIARIAGDVAAEYGLTIPGLIEAGIDLLQFDQPTLHGIDTLASYQEKAKITFWCPVDIQITLQTRDEEKIRAEARELLDKLWKGRGGFIAGYYSDNASIGLDPKWQEYACDEFVKRGRRENYV